MAEQTAVEIEFAGIRLERPPLARLYLDVTILNDRAEPRWFLLPDEVSSSAWQGPYSVFAFELYQLGSRSEVVVGHFVGTHGFFALLAPPGASLVLERFAVLHVGEMAAASIPEALRVEVLTAAGLEVGGLPAQGWFGRDPMSAACAVVEADVLEDQRGARAIKRTDGLIEVPVQVTEDRRFELWLHLPADVAVE